MPNFRQAKCSKKRTAKKEWTRGLKTSELRDFENKFPENSRFSGFAFEYVNYFCPPIIYRTIGLGSIHTT